MAPAQSPVLRRIAALLTSACLAGATNAAEPKDRYPANQWNIYAAQASDGDNLPMDNSNTINLLKMAILPLVQYYAYLEVGHAKDDQGGEASSLWRAYELVASADERMAMRKVSHRRDIYPVFRELFSREGAKAEA